MSWWKRFSRAVTLIAMQLILNTHGTSLKRKAERFLVRIPNRAASVEIAASKIQSIVVASSSSRILFSGEGLLPSKIQNNKD